MFSVALGHPTGPCVRPTCHIVFEQLHVLLREEIFFAQRNQPDALRHLVSSSSVTWVGTRETSKPVIASIARPLSHSQCLYNFFTLSTHTHTHTHTSVGPVPWKQGTFGDRMDVSPWLGLPGSKEEKASWRRRWGVQQTGNQRLGGPPRARRGCRDLGGRHSSSTYGFH